MKKQIKWSCIAAMMLMPISFGYAGEGLRHHRAQFSGHKTFVFSPGASRWSAYDANGNLVAAGRASGGKSWCGDVGRSCRTPVGTYSVYHKGDSRCKSSKYPIEEGGGAPMPHCMFFKGGFAIHGSSFVPNYPASHGCIRVTPDAARWLNSNFIERGTRVRVLPYHL